MPATAQDLRDYYERTSSASETKLNIILDAAQWDVEEFAPPPDTTETATLTDYDERLTNAMLQIAAYKFDTAGYRSNAPSFEEFGSRSFDVKGEAVYAQAQRTMGPFHQGDVAYLSRSPL